MGGLNSAPVDHSARAQAAAAQADATQALADAATAQAAANLRGTSKVIRATRDLTLASGNVAYTGFGGTPKKITIFAVVPGTTISSYGTDALGSAAAVIADAAGARNATNYPLLVKTDNSNYQLATVNSRDADGFTLTWTKTGAPTLTAELVFIAEF